MADQLPVYLCDGGQVGRRNAGCIQERSACLLAQSGQLLLALDHGYQRGEGVSALSDRLWTLRHAPFSRRMMHTRSGFGYGEPDIPFRQFRADAIVGGHQVGLERA